MLIEKFQHKWNAIGEYQMLRHHFELIHVIDFEVLQIQQQNGRDRFDDDFFVAIDIDAQFSRLCHGQPIAMMKSGKY